MNPLSISPLRWPEWYLNASHTQRFLADVPLIGLYSRVYRYIYSELAQRSHQAVELWGENTPRNRCACIVSPIIQEYGEWPNCFFVPDDPCALLFWDTSMELRSAEALYRIHGILEMPADVTEYNDRTTYGEFIDGIVSHCTF